MNSKFIIASKLDNVKKIVAGTFYFSVVGVSDVAIGERVVTEVKFEVK